MLDISRDMYIRTILTYHFTLIGRTTIKTKQKITSVDKDSRNWSPVDGMRATPMENSIEFPQKIKNRI